MEKETTDKNVIQPLMDASQNAQAYRLLLDMPGVSQENASVSAESDTLTVRGTRGEGSAALTYARKVRLPEDAVLSDVTATLAHGVLELRVARREAVGPRVVSVQAA